MKELDLSPTAYGYVASAYFWPYALSGVLAGLFLVNRIKAKWLLAILVCIWSLSQLPIAFTSSLGVLYLCRIMLGIGEGPGTPLALHACHTWFPGDRRNIPSAIVLQGSAVGFLLGSPVITAIILAYGWRAAFLSCSVLGVLWLVLWLIVGADGPISVHGTDAHAKSEPPVPWARLWLDRTMIGNYVLGFGSYWMVGLSVAWLAPYLRLGLNYDATATGWLISVMAATQPPIILSISYVSQRMLRSGVSSRVARGVFNCAGLIVAGCALILAMAVDAPALKIALLTLGFMLPPITFVFGPAMVSEIAPTAQRGVAVLVTYSAITLAGLVSPIVVGYAVQNSGYPLGFYVTAAVLIVTGCAALALLRPDETAQRFRALAVA